MTKIGPQESCSICKSSFSQFFDFVVVVVVVVVLLLLLQFRLAYLK